MWSILRDREKALQIQRPHFWRIMGTNRPWEHLQECYLVGTVKDIVARLKGFEAVGLEHVTVQPAAPDISQIELIAERVLPQFT